MSDTITKLEMARRIARRLELPLPVVQKVIQAILDGIIEDLANGKRIELRGFGVFETKRVARRIRYHFTKHEQMEVPSKIIAKFRPGAEMKKRMAEQG